MDGHPQGYLSRQYKETHCGLLSKAPRFPLSLSVCVKDLFACSTYSSFGQDFKDICFDDKLAVHISINLMSSLTSDTIHSSPQLSVAHVALTKLHKDVARTSVYSPSSSSLYSGGLDGKLYVCAVKESVAEALEKPMEVTSVSGISALCLTDTGIVICTMDGIVFTIETMTP